MIQTKALILGCLLSLLTCLSYAQENKLPYNEPNYNKPQIFADLPQRMTLRIPAMQALLQLAVGKTVSVHVSDAMSLEGMVVSKSNAKDSLVKSVVIRSSNRPGATLTFTQTTLPNGTRVYLGRYMSTNNSDVYEMVREAGQYVFVKKNLYDLIIE